ncbi:MAG TPA: 4'-phosphopantetheinyl transferase superfamily protein [Bryobacteraceae bacterium]|nr:4'-phosphopantetheinyl transferase superfamily protein [Bryobacteraceae bacterium]
MILGQCLDVAPARVEFAHSASGKPFLRDTTLRFNASRSADIALMAIADGLEVGVDVERVHPQPEMQRIARRFFSSRDFAELQKAPAEAQAEVFFRLWTQTEARLKASGLGLGGARRQRHEHWPVCEVNPEVGYAGAVAAETCGINLTLHEFNFSV